MLDKITNRRISLKKYIKILFFSTVMFLVACSKSNMYGNQSSLPLSVVDDCTQPGVQIAILREAATRAVPVIFRAAYGANWTQFGTRLRADTNEFAIQNLLDANQNMREVNLGLVKGYDSSRYFQLLSSKTVKYNEATEASKCEFTVRVLGSKAAPRKLSFVVGDSEIDAKKITYLLPENDVVVGGVLIVNKNVIASVTTELDEWSADPGRCDRDWRSLVEGRCSFDVFEIISSRIIWSFIDFTDFGKVNVGPTKTGSEKQLRSAALYVWCSPAAWAWSAQHRFEGQKIDRKNPYVNNVFPRACIWETGNESGWYHNPSALEDSPGTFIWRGASQNPFPVLGLQVNQSRNLERSHHRSQSITSVPPVASRAIPSDEKDYALRALGVSNTSDNASNSRTASGFAEEVINFFGRNRPPYPSASRRLGEEGEVTAQINVSPSGEVSCEIQSSSGAARLGAAVKQWCESKSFEKNARTGSAETISFKRKYEFYLEK